MFRQKSRTTFIAALALVIFIGPFSLKSGPLAAVEDLPAQLSDEAFWKLFTDFSEGGGFFRSDNFVSNETGFQFVLKGLEKARSGGVYLGVGPDQNFTYIVAMKPKMAVIFDIRRQNAMQHLMYKALIEMSTDRADFLSKLFSRKRPEGLSARSTPEELFDAYYAATPDRQLFGQTFEAIKQHLKEKRKFKLSMEDETSISFVFSSFYSAGPDLTYNGVNGFGRGRMPSYGELMEMTDEDGVNRSYMGTEENFQTLQDYQRRNLIVPVVGDFAGPKAIRSVAAYLKEHDAFVSAFYLSNVEQYLFQQGDDWNRFYRNVQTLPIDPTSTFIRSVFNNAAAPFNLQPNGFDLRSASLLSSIPQLLEAVNSGAVRSYYDVISFSK